MEFLTKMFSESGGVSSMRVMSVWTVFSATIIGVYGLYTKIDLSGLAMLCGVFLGSGIGGKVVQKFGETKESAK